MLQQESCEPDLQEDCEPDLSEEARESAAFVTVEPLEVDEQSREPQRDDRLFSWKDPWFPTALIGFAMTPVLACSISILYRLTGRLWTTILFTVHLTASTWVIYGSVPLQMHKPPPTICRRLVIVALDAYLFLGLYTGIWSTLIHTFFTDIDGTIVIEYKYERRNAQLLRLCCWLIGVSKVLVEVISMATIFFYQRYDTEITEHPQCPRTLGTFMAAMENRFAWSTFGKQRLRLTLRVTSIFMFVVSTGICLWSCTSLALHVGSFKPPEQHSPLCDPLDKTECVLPFPSFYFTIEDETTTTGRRVNLQPETLPHLRGGIEIHPEFLNTLDGFSTMAPLLFYVHGLKEGDEAGSNAIRLQGPRNIALSTTSESLTLLLDVEKNVLVPHSAEIDYLDNDRPLVLAFPSAPLRHNAHYALAVYGARDVDGNLLSQTPGMNAIMKNDGSDSNRRSRFLDTVIPALRIAAPWIDKEMDMLQLLFDFPTISEDSQLGDIRAVRDATMLHLDSADWIWKDHVHVNKIQNNWCGWKDQTIARTIHAELDVPWFLEGYGPGHRGAVLDVTALNKGIAQHRGRAHFVVHIPCSVRAAALEELDAKNVRAFVEFGHGLFFNRGEASDGFLGKLANDNGYIITAMDWRGMSSFDLLVIVKVLMSQPSLFQAIRDNLIQGYANKLALQHFTKDALLSMDWMEFGPVFNRNKRIPTYNGQNPESIFYGISQGGILGAGYTTLLGPTKLIDRGVLGVPGTPFALVMSRSFDFKEYDTIMMLNFYNNRHVRIFLSLAQMMWDSCEASGLLAPPFNEEHPRMLLQAGLGDPVVPTIAAEALARAYGAVTVTSNPRQIFGVPVEPAESSSSLGPDVTLTELLYEKEFAALPESDKFADNNSVHWCLRWDKSINKQIAEFINTGQVVDICANDGCRRKEAICGHGDDADDDDDGGVGGSRGNDDAP